jgi:DNA-binding MarR family transcriptional regulator
MKRLTLNKFGDRLIELFPILMKEISRHESNYVASGKITLPQVWALEYLSRCDECGMHELAEFMNIKLPSATGMVDRMIKQGLVTRDRGKMDRRTVLVQITNKGNKILKEMYVQKRKGMIELFSKLSLQERLEYMEILEKLVKNLSSVGCKQGVKSK